MRYLVTGGGGFIGAYTVHELLKRGHEPFVYDSHLHGNTLSLLLDSRTLPEAQIISGSISDFHRLPRCRERQPNSKDNPRGFSTRSRD